MPATVLVPSSISLWLSWAGSWFLNRDCNGEVEAIGLASQVREGQYVDEGFNFAAGVGVLVALKEEERVGCGVLGWCW